MAKPIQGSKKKKLPPIIFKENDPEALYRSKDEQLDINNRARKARKKAEEAFNLEMSKVKEPESKERLRLKNSLVQQSKNLSNMESEMKGLETELEETKLQAEKKKIKMDIGMLNKKISNVKVFIDKIKSDLLEETKEEK